MEPDRGITWNCLPHQYRFLRAICGPESEHRNVALIAGAGAGKTVAFAMAAFHLAAANPGMPGILTEPTYPMVTGILEPAIDELAEQYGIPIRFSARKHDYYLPWWDATIMCRSGEKPRRLRGPSVGWFGMDEVGDQAKEVFTTLQGRMRHKRAGLRRAMMCGTPRGFDWVYSLFGEIGGRDRLPSSILLRAAAADNTIVTAADPDWIQGMRESYDPELFKQEVLGEFVAIGQHTTYYAFTRAENVSKIVERKKGLPVIVMVDFKHSPMAWVVGQYQDGKLVCLAETNGEGTTTEGACDWVIDGFGTPGRETVYQVFGDASSATPVLSQNYSDFEIIRDKLMCSPKVNRRTPRLRDRTNSSNALLENAMGDHRLIVHESCTRLIRDYEQTRNIAGTLDIDGSDTMLSHYARAVSFYAVMEHPILAGRGQFPQRDDGE